ncbi:MAG: hypothetical protein JSV33_00980 [bacterium]|nr:MAG: hypothetical protein JSV33_00980 [bacterium]
MWKDTLNTFTALTLLACLVLGSVSVHGEEQLRRAAHPRSSSNGRYQRMALERFLDGRSSTVDSLSILVFRVSFPDRDFKDGSIDGIVHDSLYFANELRHVREYYDGASRGRFTPNTSMAPGVLQMSREEGYYGEEGFWQERVVEMLMEVVEAADMAIDFRPYDAIAIIHAGAGQETDIKSDSPEQLWSGFIDPGEMAEALADTLGTPGVPTNDSIGGEPHYIDNLMILPEDPSQDGQIFGSLGIYVYQVGLRIGMVQLFDTTPSDYPDSQGIGSFGLMGYGLYNAAGFIPAFPCAFHRYLMGWIDAMEVTHNSVEQIQDVNRHEPYSTHLLRVPLGSTEYFLIANRVHDSDFDGRFDFTDLNGNGIPENEDTLLGAEFDFFLTATTNPTVLDTLPGGEIVRRRITGSGLMIWHIDEGIIRRQLAIGRYPNDNRALKGVDLEEADGIQDLDRPSGKYGLGSHFDSYRKGNNDRFAGDTEPSSDNNCSVASGIEISGISEADSSMSITVSFDRPAEVTSLELAGSMRGLSPIPADVDGDGSEEMVVAADTGFIYLVYDAGEASWRTDVDTIRGITSFAWAGSPVLADVNYDDDLEIFITSRDASLHAVSHLGAFLQIDVDDSHGSLRLLGSSVSLPLVIEADGDDQPEVLALSSTADTVYGYLLYSSEIPSGGGTRYVGREVVEWPLAPGRLASHPARGIVIRSRGEIMDGFFFCAWQGEEGDLDLYYIPLRASGQEPLVSMAPSHHRISGASFPWYLATPAAGDIDNDGSDEFVIGYPGLGLVYYSPSGGVWKVDLAGGRPSAPALEDLDRDGVLETALRDELALYLFTGFGILETGWPNALSDIYIDLETRSPPAPPILWDLDTDGKGEVLFLARGDLYAMRIDGTLLPDWPLPGWIDDPGSPALVIGSGSMLHIFMAGDGTSLIDQAGGGAVTDPVGLLARYSFDYPVATGRGWPFYRHDAGGSSRQDSSVWAGTVERYVEEESFIVYPNPATTGTFTVRVLLAAPAHVTVRIMNIEGELVREVTKRHDFPEGSRVYFEETVQTDEISSGVYLCYLEASGVGWQWNGRRKFAVLR